MLRFTDEELRLLFKALGRTDFAILRFGRGSLQVSFNQEDVSSCRKESGRSSEVSMHRERVTRFAVYMYGLTNEDWSLLQKLNMSLQG